MNSSDFISDDTENNTLTGITKKNVNEYWYKIDPNVTPTKENPYINRVDPDNPKTGDTANPQHLGSLDILCANMLESSYYYDTAWTPKTTDTSRLAKPGKIMQDHSNGIKYILSETTMVDDDKETANIDETVTLKSHDIFVNNDLSKKVVILTYFG